METVWRGRASRLASSICLAALVACSSGGGGSTVATNTPTTTNTSGNTTSGNTTSGNTTSGNTTSGNTTPLSVLTFSSPPPSCSANVCVTAAGAPTFGSATPVTENGATPNFSTSLPPVGTTFPLLTSGWQLSLHTVSDASVSGGTVTFQGVSAGHPILQISIPSISLNASNIVTDGSTTTLSDGSRLNFGSGVLNYAALGMWSYFPQSGAGGFEGAALTGYQTQAGHVPTSGSATYNGVSGTVQGAANAGGVVGQIWVPSQSGNPIQGGGLSGNATVNVNFGSGSVSGQLTNMTVSASGAVPWNNVNLAGSLSGASLSGTTSTSGPPAGSPALFPQGFSSAATGTFKGALYGPNANEIGAIWSLSEPTSDGGKSALGVIGATAATTP